MFGERGLVVGESFILSGSAEEAVKGGLIGTAVPVMGTDVAWVSL